MDDYQLNERVQEESDFIHNLPLSEVRLAKDGRYPWLILVPRRKDICEIIDLELVDQRQLFDEITVCSHLLRTLTKPDKLNVAALGNIVPQLHIHVIARFCQDAAWPNPIWGNGIAQYRTQQQTQDLVADYRSYFLGKTPG